MLASLYTNQQEVKITISDDFWRNMCYNVYGFQRKVERQRRKNRIMEEKKVLYSKRFPKERPFDLEKEIEQLNKEHKPFLTLLLIGSFVVSFVAFALFLLKILIVIYLQI